MLFLSYFEGQFSLFTNDKKKKSKKKVCISTLNYGHRSSSPLLILQHLHPPHPRLRVSRYGPTHHSGSSSILTIYSTKISPYPLTRTHKSINQFNESISIVVPIFPNWWINQPKPIWIQMTQNHFYPNNKSIKVWSYQDMQGLDKKGRAIYQDEQLISNS